MTRFQIPTAIVWIYEILKYILYYWYHYFCVVRFMLPPGGFHPELAQVVAATSGSTGGTGGTGGWKDGQGRREPWKLIGA